MSGPKATHDAIVADWQQKAQKHDDQNYRFLRSLKNRTTKEVDRIALQLHQEAFEIVDCTRCANCCCQLQVVFTDEDIDRIANHRGMTREAFIAAYLEWDQEKHRFRARMTPCPFLGEDNKCSIYDVRPDTCRRYPYTDQDDFAFRSITHSRNALVCPAAFYVVEQMKKRLPRAERG